MQKISTRSSICNRGFSDRFAYFLLLYFLGLMSRIWEYFNIIIATNYAK